MSKASRRRSDHIRITLALTVVLLTTAAHSQEPPKSEPAPGAGEQGIDRSTPVDVYRSYLNAIKKNDLAAAKACWWLPGEEKSGLDLLAGMWVAFHRFNSALDQASIDRRHFGDNFARDDCTDASINRTLARLKQSEAKVDGDTAKLVVEWEEDDGSPDPVFWFGNDPIPFRKTEQGWHLDALALCGIEKPEALFAEGSWGLIFRSQTEMMNEVASGLESGKLKSAKDVVLALEKHVGSLEGRIPLTRTVIYEEDTPTRYLKMGKGRPGVVACGPAQLPHRKDIKWPRKVEGDIETVFSEMYGIDRPKIVVETSNKKGYEVIFDPDDDQAMEIVADQLGMTIGMETREILALQITVDEGGHKLKQVERPDKPQGRPATRNGVWPLHGVTMGELARFLETRFRRPVVNRTGLDGYYWLELSGDAAKLWPQELDEIKPLDQTGLRLSWRHTTASVLVVKDK